MDNSLLPGLYIHIPFCIRKCNYCDFFSVGRKDCAVQFGESVYDDYARAVLTQISSLADDSANGPFGTCVPREFDSVYIGGGTPTLLEPELISRVLNSITCSFSIKDGAEITIEANPGTITREKLSEYKRSGVNRLSIGVQALDDDLLGVLGRVHTADEAVRSVKLARKFFDNINVDFIFGIPGLKGVSEPQTVEQAGRCARFVSSLDIPHASFYGLIKEPGTAIYRWDEEGRLTDVDDQAEREMYYKISDMLRENGYVQYEISNFARPGHQSRHNLKYWSGAQYLGIGAGSVSYLKIAGGNSFARFKTSADIGRYIASPGVQDLSDSYELQETLAVSERKKEFMMLGFRKTAGPDAGQYASLFGGDSLFEDFKTELTELTDGQYIRSDLSLTRKGLDMANEIFMKFI